MDRKIDIEKFLKPTVLIDSDHPDIHALARKLTDGAESVSEKARRLFYFIRDEVRYVFRAEWNEEAYKASSILQSKRGFCTQKAILFCALARSAAIPAGLFFYDIRDHALPKPMVKLLKTEMLYRHGIVSLYLNHNWRQFDATLDIQLCRNHDLIPVEFDPGSDCLMSPITQTGFPHIEYGKEYGLTHDIFFQDILRGLKLGYPHLFPDRNFLLAIVMFFSLTVI